MVDAEYVIVVQEQLIKKIPMDVPMEEENVQLEPRELVNIANVENENQRMVERKKIIASRENCLCSLENKVNFHF